MAGGTLVRTPHFALHRLVFTGVDRQHSETPGPGVAAAEARIKPRLTAPVFEKTGVWMGAMVPKRWAKRAVTRNAIKRQIYSVSDRAKTELVDSALVVRLRAGFDAKTFPSATSDALKQAVRLELDQLFVKAANSLKERVTPLTTCTTTHGGPIEALPAELHTQVKNQNGQPVFTRTVITR